MKFGKSSTERQINICSPMEVSVIICSIRKGKESFSHKLDLPLPKLTCFLLPSPLLFLSSLSLH